MTKLTYSSIYLLKFIACFFVVACHVPLIGNLKNIVLGPIMYACVPIFFMISGFFLDLSKEKFNKNLKKSIKLLKIILAVNLTYLICVYFNHGLIVKNAKDIIDVFIFGNVVSGHLWYLSAYLVSLVILCISSYFLSDKYIKYLPLLALIGLAMSSYNIFFSQIISSKNVLNALFTGIPYMSIGYCLKKYEITTQFKRMSFYLIIFFILLNYLEIYIIHDMENIFPISGYYITTLPLSVAIFVFFISRKNTSEHGFLENIGLHDSGNIYYFHVLIWTALQTLSNHVFGNTLNINSIYTQMGGVIVFIITIIFSRIINYIQHKIKINIFR